MLLAPDNFATLRAGLAVATGKNTIVRYLSTGKNQNLRPAHRDVPLDQNDRRKGPYSNRPDILAIGKKGLAPRLRRGYLPKALLNHCVRG